MQTVTVLLMGLSTLVSASALPPPSQVMFQPLQNILVLPPFEKLQEQENATKALDKPQEEPLDHKPVSMDELKKAEGSVTGSYHVLLENGRLRRVDYTAAPRPVQEAIRVEPEVRSWYYTQVPADVLQRYYAEYSKQNSEYKRPSTNQASSSNSQGVSQSASHGVNQASNHNVQVFHQGKQAAVMEGKLDTSASQVEHRRQSPGGSVEAGPSPRPDRFNAQQNLRSPSEVETFSPVQTPGRQEDPQVPSSPQGVVATVYYSDVSPVTGPVYAFQQTPLVRVLREV